MQFNLSRKWVGVNDEIVMGLIQDLLNKIYKTKKSSINIDLYHNFIKSLHYAIEKNQIDPTLEKSFNRVNDEYFNGLIEIPNLIWGNLTKRKLGCYDFHKDTITISRIFLSQEKELLDYVMYHEMLHKKLKFKSSGRKTLFHSKEFKKAEKEFKNAEEIERKLKYIRVRKKPRNNSFFGFLR